MLYTDVGENPRAVSQCTYHICTVIPCSFSHQPYGRGMAGGGSVGSASGIIRFPVA